MSYTLGGLVAGIGSEYHEGHIRPHAKEPRTGCVARPVLRALRAGFALGGQLAGPTGGPTGSVHAGWLGNRGRSERRCGRPSGPFRLNPLIWLISESARGGRGASVRITSLQSTQ